MDRNRLRVVNINSQDVATTQLTLDGEVVTYQSDAFGGRPIIGEVILEEEGKTYLVKYASSGLIDVAPIREDLSNG